MTDARDFLGNPVTGASAEDIVAIDHFIGGLIAYETRIVRILDAAKGEAVPVLVAVFAGILHLLAETTGQEATARPWLDRARDAAERTAPTPREAQWIAVLDHWCAENIDSTLAATES